MEHTRGQLKVEHLEEMREYLKSDANLKQQKENLLIQIVAYLNNKYPNSSVTMDLEKELFHVEGEDRATILLDLVDIGVLPNN